MMTAQPWKTVSVYQNGVVGEYYYSTEEEGIIAFHGRMNTDVVIYCALFYWHPMTDNWIRYADTRRGI